VTYDNRTTYFFDNDTFSVLSIKDLFGSNLNMRLMAEAKEGYDRWIPGYIL
jgi:flavorubredoxin